jgi:hypothetical protein
MKLSAHCMPGGNMFWNNLSWLFFNDTYAKQHEII